MTAAYIGKPTSRVDGRAKVSGKAKYAAEYNVPDLTYGYVVSSAVATGRITRIDAVDALKLPGVLQVFTHENIPALARSAQSYSDEVAPEGSPLRPLHDDTIKYSAQPVALVVADSFELARYAASLVRIEYDHAAHVTDLDKKREEASEPEKDIPAPRGNADKAFAAAAVQLEAEYRVPVEHHNPMELFATTVIRDEDGKLTVYDKTQGVQNVQSYLCNVFALFQTRFARHVAFRRRRVRRWAAPAVPGIFGSPGGARVEALGAGVAHAAADVQLGVSPPDLAARRARCRARRRAPGHYP
jgi:xanthine dehydrogenase YagR molybdenum-binding subunit